MKMLIQHKYVTFNFNNVKSTNFRAVLIFTFFCRHYGFHGRHYGFLEKSFSKSETTSYQLSNEPELTS